MFQPQSHNFDNNPTTCHSTRFHTKDPHQHRQEGNKNHNSKWPETSNPRNRSHSPAHPLLLSEA